MIKNNSFLTSLSKDLVKEVRDLMAGKKSIETPLEELGEAAKTLTDKQKKLDKNNNGKLDADDFRRLRAEGIDRVVIHSPYTPDIHGGLAEVTHRDIRTGVVTVMFENMYYKLKKGQFKELPEEFEQLDELSKKTLGSYIKKAVPNMQAMADASDRNHQKGHETYKAGAIKTSDAYLKLSDKQNRKALNRADGIFKAADRLTKEEVEDLDEGASKNFGSAVKKAEASRQRAIKRAGMSVHKGQSIENALRDHDLFAKDKDAVLAHASSLKKTNEEVELDEGIQLDELSNDTLRSYMKKSKADPAFEKRRGKISNERKAIMAKRTKGQQMASSALSANFAKQSAAIEKQHHENIAHVRNNVGKALESHGYKLMTTHEKRDVYAKPNPQTGHVFTATVHHAGSQPSSGHEPQVLSMASSSGWQSSDNRHYIRKHPSKDGSSWRSDYSRAATKKEALDSVHDHIKKFENDHNSRSEHMYESVEETNSDVLNELSKSTLGSYIKKASPSASAALATAVSSSNPESIKTAGKRFSKRSIGINSAVNKLSKEDVELNVDLTQEEIDNIEATLADLDEGRGRPPKEGSEAWKRRQTQSAEDIPALGIQLRKAASINKPVTFANGESKQIHPNHINRFNDHMDARKTSQEKSDFQKIANKSHADFVKAVSADIPQHKKDTGEIVKYGK